MSHKEEEENDRNKSPSFGACSLSASQDQATFFKHVQPQGDKNVGNQSTSANTNQRQ
jgi:hypothetical protein